MSSQIPNMTYFNNIKFPKYGDLSYHVASCQFRYFPYYGLQFIYSGEISLSVNDSPAEYSLNPVLFFTYPGASFSYGPPKSSKSGVRSQIYICFEGERVDDYIAGGLLAFPKNTPYFIRINDYSMLHEKMSRIIGMLNAPNASFQTRAVLKFEELLLFIHEQRCNVDSFQSRHKDIIEDLEMRIAQNAGYEWDFELEAKAQNLSYAHFRRLFKQHTGFSPWNYLIECRLRNASRLLSTTVRRVGEITIEAGFNDEFYFSKKFKSRFGESPSAFRMRHKSSL